MGTLFGTDGIRGRVNTPPVTVETAIRVGKALASGDHSTAARVVIGQDTRRSGDMLADALGAGVCAAGGTAIHCGIIPTPAVSFMVRHLEADYGAVISASHNPPEDNGIKLFNRQGHKLSDSQESALERRIVDPGTDPALGKTPGRRCDHDDASKQYADFIVNTSNQTQNARHLRVVVDCANGAAYRVAPMVFNRLDVTCDVIHNAPDGQNINVACGSQHLASLSTAVKETAADAGLAFDGDADRLIAVDEHGHPLTGDQLIAIFARDLLERDRLDGKRVVTTVMSNVGLREKLSDLGIIHDVSDVGDRHVMEMMKQTGAVLGGEDSGHIIFRRLHATGDGILSAVQLIDVLSANEQPLSQLAGLMTVYPQVLLAVPVSSKPPLEQQAPIQAVIRLAESALGRRGRVLVRYSGTQSVCRVMVEGPDADATAAHCRRIADVVADHLK